MAVGLGSSATFVSCLFASNAATMGGAIYVDGGSTPHSAMTSVDLIDCDFEVFSH